MCFGPTTADQLMPGEVAVISCSPHLVGGYKATAQGRIKQVVHEGGLCMLSLVSPLADLSAPGRQVIVQAGAPAVRIPSDEAGRW